MVGLLFAPVSAAAQQVPADLTLSQALQISRDNHPSYGVQSARLDAADAQERSSAWWLSLLPNVSISSGYGVTQSRILTGTDEFGRPVRLDDPISFRRTDSDFGPDIGQITLFDGGANIRNARSTRASVRASRAGVDAETFQFESQLVRSYYAAVQAERRIDLEDRLLGTARLNLDAADRLMRVGAQDPLDRLGAELAVADAEGRLETALGDVRKARLTLADAMGVPRETEFTLSDELPEVFDPATLDVDQLIGLALGENPSLAQVAASADQQRYDLMNQRMSRWPIVNATLSTRRGSAQGTGSDPLFYLNPLNQTYTFGVNVRLNLFDRFQSSSRIAQSRANYAASNETVRLRRLQTESDVRGAVLDLENLYRSLERLDRRSELGRQQVEMAEEKYRLGSLSFRDLQSSIDTAYQAEYDALTARFDFVTALLALEEAVGTSIR